ncbi:MAG: radical SAM protein [Bacillota bacterium]|nr:radical SAM protein [Bacillota bacterium]
MKFKKLMKYLNLFTAYIFAKCSNTTPFVRIIPTDKCNLKCEYCWQHKNSDLEINEEEYKLIVKKAINLKVGIISFLGGEPLIWRFIYDAIKLCSDMNIITDITTNGTLLNKESIMRLSENGLDFLNISVDGVTTVKNLKCIEKNIEYLRIARDKYGVKIRVNAVITTKNFDEIMMIIEYLNQYRIPISLGYAMPSLEHKRMEGEIFFSEQDKQLIDTIIKYVRTKKKEGYKIIDPIDYFENIYKYIRREKFWECNYPGVFGWINVIGGCKIRSCTKKMDELNYSYLDLNSKKIKELKLLLLEMTKECNKKCYSNCAYDSYYYKNNKIKLFKKLLN